MIWEVLADDERQRIERIPYAGGHLVRAVWRFERFAKDAWDGSGIVFVPEPIPEPVEVAPDAPQETEPDPVHEAEVEEADG